MLTVIGLDTRSTHWYMGIGGTWIDDLPGLGSGPVLMLGPVTVSILPNYYSSSICRLTQFSFSATFANARLRLYFALGYFSPRKLIPKTSFG